MAIYLTTAIWHYNFVTTLACITSELHRIQCSYSIFYLIIVSTSRYHTSTTPCYTTLLMCAYLAHVYECRFSFVLFHFYFQLRYSSIRFLCHGQLQIFTFKCNVTFSTLSACVCISLHSNSPCSYCLIIVAIFSSPSCCCFWWSPNHCTSNKKYSELKKYITIQTVQIYGCFFLYWRYIILQLTI